jgi:DNA-binding transcriptional MerR regulator
MEVAEILDMSERTLRRKLASGIVPEPRRDSVNNYRIWTPDEVQMLRQNIEREKA